MRVLVEAPVCPRVMGIAARRIAISRRLSLAVVGKRRMLGGKLRRVLGLAIVLLVVRRVLLLRLLRGVGVLRVPV